MRKTAFRRVFNTDFDEFYQFRYVLSMLTLRDIKLRYKQTLLGISWVILQPLLPAVLFAFIFDRGLHLPHPGNSYLLFAYAALIPWMIFSQSLQRASPSIVNDDRLITKVYFPRLFIPLSATLGVIVDYCIALGMGCGIALFQGLSLTRLLLLFPFATIHLFLFCSSVNVLVAGLNVYFRDLKHVTPFFIQFGMFACPIVYPLSAIPASIKWLYLCNPLVGIIELYRFMLMGAAFPIQPLVFSLSFTLIIACGSLITFQKLERNFADVI